MLPSHQNFISAKSNRPSTTCIYQSRPPVVSPTIYQLSLSVDLRGPRGGGPALQRIRNRYSQHREQKMKNPPHQKGKQNLPLLLLRILKPLSSIGLESIYTCCAFSHYNWQKLSLEKIFLYQISKKMLTHYLPNWHQVSNILLLCKALCVLTKKTTI